MEVRGNRKAVISDYRIRIEVCKAHSDNNHVESMRVNIGFSYKKCFLRIREAVYLPVTQFPSKRREKSVTEESHCSVGSRAKIAHFDKKGLLQGRLQRF